MADDVSVGKIEMPYSTPHSGSRMTVVQERDSYKEKLVHMKMVMREMQQNLQSQKIRKEGVETVSILLKEARQQIATLENQKRALETAVRNLQNRLANHGLSNSVTFEENELFIPGTSKQILDNLAKENSRLRNLIGKSGNYDDVTKLHETIQQVQTVNSNIQIERDNLQQKCADLESMLKSSDSEKDKMMTQLREQIEKLQSNSRTQDVLCQSMGGEVSGLRQQLRDFMLQCQQLEIKLEESERVQETRIDYEVPSKEAKSEEQGKDTPDGNILVEENTRLKDEIKTLKEMNRRWQDYNNDRERYTQELNSNYRELQARYKRDEETRITEEKERQLNNLIITAKEKIEKMGTEKKQMEEQLSLHEATIQNQAGEIQRLKSVPAFGDEETITALKAQIQVCTEDFETERRDRAMAQAKVHQLTEELSKLQMENQQLKYNMQTVQPMQPAMPLMQPRQPYNRHQSMLQEMPVLQARGWQKGVVTDGANIETDSKSNLNNLSKMDKMNPMRTYRSAQSNLAAGPLSLPVIKSQASDSGLPKSPGRKSEDTLCCPKCSQGFSEEEQDKLLEHMEICCE